LAFAAIGLLAGAPVVALAQTPPEEPVTGTPSEDPMLGTPSEQPPPGTSSEETVVVTPPHEAVLVLPAAERVKVSDREGRTNMKTANIRVGGGVEGLGLTLDNRLTSGPLWSAAVGFQPLSWLGLEAGYSGSTHEIDSSFFPVGATGAVAGADFVRNGGQIAMTVNAPLPIVQPYALAGVGVDSYNWRGPDNIGFKDDTSGRVPLGGGVRGAVGPFIGDVRFNYNVLFDQQFARLSTNDQIGSTWDLGAQVGGQF
jgi:hypothetical protein